MKILALDTSSRYGSVAVCDGELLVAEYTTQGVLNQTERLLPVLERVLADVGWSITDLDGFAVVHGPGSFTGVRVGLATIQGLALAANRPAIGISSLKALALGVPFSRYPICAVLDARKGEIYTALYRWIEGEVEELEPEQVCDPATFLARLSGPVLFVGDGVHVVTELLSDHSRIEAHLATGSSSLPRASVIAVWAGRVLTEVSPHGRASLAPHYLRVSEAELKLRKAVDTGPDGQYVPEGIPLPV